MLGRIALLMFVMLGVATCGGSRTSDHEVPAGDPLVLELGGDATPLREVLRRAEGATQSERRSPPTTDEPTPPVVDPPPPEPVRQFRTVTLAEGQTLISLCRQWLNDGTRWHEVMELNGWTEAQTRRLRTGQVVKLPLD